jgi:hypothetical protein
VACNGDFAVKHFLLEYHDFLRASGGFYNVNSLKELFGAIPSGSITGCLKGRTCVRGSDWLFFVVICRVLHNILSRHDMAIYVFTCRKIQTNKQTSYVSRFTKTVMVIWRLSSFKS